jgi:O-antigen ligase
VGWSQAVPRDKLWSLLRGLMLPAVVLAGFGLLQFLELFQPFRFADTGEGSRVAITSLAGSAGDLAAFLVLPCLLSQLELWSSRRWSRLGWSVVLLLCLWCLAATQTVAPLVALLVGSSVMWGLLLERRRLVAAATAMALVLLSTVGAVAPLRERLGEKWEQLRAGELDAALSGRLDGWRAAIWMLEEHPLAGVGHGAYRAEFAAAKLALIDDGVELYRGHRHAAFGNAHNEYLEAGAEWGIPGLAALAWAFWVSLRFSIRRSRRADRGATRERLKRSFGWAALAALGFLAVAYFPMRLALTAYPALLLLSFLLGSEEEAA